MKERGEAGEAEGQASGAATAPWTGGRGAAGGAHAAVTALLSTGRVEVEGVREAGDVVVHLDNVCGGRRCEKEGSGKGADIGSGEAGDSPVLPLVIVW
jgi:hypothetical protein